MEHISGNYVDIESGAIFPATIKIAQGKIAEIQRKSSPEKTFLIPGFIDAHIHTESSLLPPAEFARLVVTHGTVATVSDPHEIGNVLGVKGIEYMLENAALVPFKFYFGASPCVPATTFETAGARLGPEEIRFLLSKDKIKYLSEVMNFPDVIKREPEVMAKIAIAKKLMKKVDGHAPGVTGEDLIKYITAGIDTDHECTRYEEAREKRDRGMKILVREGAAARNFDALFPLMREDPDHCMLCCDDERPDFLARGHINLLVREAVKRGMDPIQVLRCASRNPVIHYGLDVGLLRLGDPADFIQVSDLKDFHVMSTYIDGACVAKEGKALFSRIKSGCPNFFNADRKQPSDFRVKAEKGRLKVIEAIDGQLITNLLEVEPRIQDGNAVADPARDILKITVVNRYRNEPPCVAFIKNFGLKRGAIASSIAHDSHNVIAVGTDDEALCRAVNCIIDHKGGIAVIDDKEECLPLPIAGLMSDREAHEVAELYEKLDGMAKGLGSPLGAPFMTLSFMALLVIPRLKISDRGLFDQRTFSFTSLFG